MVLTAIFFQIWRWRTLNIERYPIQSNFAHPNYVKTSGKQIIYLYAEQSSMFQILARRTQKWDNLILKYWVYWYQKCKNLSIRCKDMAIFRTWLSLWRKQKTPPMLENGLWKKTDTTICLYILPGVVAEGPFYHSVNCRLNILTK